MHRLEKREESIELVDVDERTHRNVERVGEVKAVSIQLPQCDDGAIQYDV